MQDVNPRVSVTHQGNIAEKGLHTGCEVRDPAGVECGESKLAKMACSGSLAPHFLNNDYVTAETIYNTACVHHEVLGHKLLWAVCLDEFSMKALAAFALRLHWSDTMVMLFEVML